MALLTTYRGCAVQRLGGKYIASDASGLNAKSFSKKAAAIDYIFHQIKTNKKWTFLDLKVSVNSKRTNAQPNMNRERSLITPLSWRTKIWNEFLRLWSLLQYFGLLFRAKERNQYAAEIIPIYSVKTRRDGI